MDYSQILVVIASGLFFVFGLLIIERKMGKAQQKMSENYMQSFGLIQSQFRENLDRAVLEIAHKVTQIGQLYETRFQDLNQNVEKKLDRGFERTTATFADVARRLTIIDEAQKKISELSHNVVNLKEVLSDKKTRGVFGESQLSALIRNVLPESCFKFQYAMESANGDKVVVDCMLFLPAPTGNVPVDSKFPLENYRRMIASGLSDVERKQYERLFRQDIKKHINDIAKKYVVRQEIGGGAVLFLPSEAIFAEIHASHFDLVEEAFAQQVWITSPTTFMAILSTARSVIKDAATKQQVNVIRDHLSKLGKDFERFQKRMDDLANHVRMAHNDVEDVSISAKKIFGHFQKIEKGDVEEAQELLPS